MGQDAGSRNWGDMGRPERNEIRKGENHRHLRKVDWIYTLVSLKGRNILKEVINNWRSNKQFWRSLYIEEVINNSVFERPQYVPQYVFN